MPIRLALVRAIAAALGPAHSESEVADAVLDAVCEHLGACTATLWLLSPDRTAITMAYARNAHPDAVARFPSVPLDSELPGAEVLRSGEPVFLASQADRDHRWPALAGTRSASEGMAVLPLEVDGQRLGVVSFGFPTPRDFDREDRTALMAVADQCAIALDRANLYQEARADAAANHLLARISGLIGRSHAWTELAQEVVNTCSESFVDSCVVYISEGNLVRRVAAASRSYPDIAREIVDRFPTPLSGEAPQAVAIRTGQPVHVAPLTAERLATAHPPAWRALLERFQVELGDAWMIPLREGERAFGAMLFAMPSGRSLETGDLALAHRAAERTADLIRSATVFAQQRATLETLYEVLLPIGLPEVAGMELAASYVPHGEGSDVGGDWWDALALPDGRIGLSVGDVAGHGIPAAVVMGQLRNALRLHLVSGSDPTATLTGLSRLLDWTNPTAHATAIAAIVDPSSGALEWTAAGHPPPLLLAGDGSTQLLETPPAPPLGLQLAAGGPAYRASTTVLRPGDTFCLYTDGLVEGRRRSLDAGFAALRANAGLLADPDLQRGCDELVARLVDQQDDDICVLAVRRAA